MKKKVLLIATSLIALDAGASSRNPLANDGTPGRNAFQSRLASISGAAAPVSSPAHDPAVLEAQKAAARTIAAAQARSLQLDESRQKEIAKLRATVKGLEAEKLALTAEKAKSLSELVAKTTEIEELEARYAREEAEKVAQIAAKEQEIADARATIEAKDSEFKAKEAELAALKASHSESTGQSTEAIASLEAKLKAIGEERDGLGKALEKTKAALATEQERLEQSKAMAIAALEKEAQARASAERKHEKDVAALLAVNAQLSTALDALPERAPSSDAPAPSGLDAFLGDEDTF